MPTRQSQLLFAYGTLRSAHPEHRQCFANVLSIRSANIPGALWTLKEGYPLLVIDREQCLLEASSDSRSDWSKGLDALRMTDRISFEDASLVEGELIELVSGNAALADADRWEGYERGRRTVYRRLLCPVWLDDGSKALSWIYGAYSPPPGATRFEGSRWPSPLG